ncbi:hypothetical protein DFH06DRAFT_1259538, partial [Mycena polygramma]
MWRLRALPYRARRGAARQRSTPSIEFPRADLRYRKLAAGRQNPPWRAIRRSRAFAYTVRRSAARQASTLCIDFRRVAGAVCVHAFQASIFGLPSTVVALPATFMASQRRHSPPATYRIPMGQQKTVFNIFGRPPSRHLTAADLASSHACVRGPNSPL